MAEKLFESIIDNLGKETYTGERSKEDGLKLYPKVTYTKKQLDDSQNPLPDGITGQVQDTNYGGTLMYDQGPYSAGVEYMKNKNKTDILKEDQTLFKDTTDNENTNFILGYDKDNKSAKVKFDKEGNAQFQVGLKFADGGTATPKRGLVDGPGSYSVTKLTISEALAKIFETQTTFKNRKELLGKLEALGVKNTNIKTLTPVRYPILSTVIYTDHASTRVTEKMLEEKIGKEELKQLRKEGVPEKKIRSRVYSKKYFATLPTEKKAKKVEDTRQRNKNLSEEKIIDRKEKALVRRQPKKGYSFYKVNKAESLLWNDLLRTAKNKNGYFTFKGEAPISGKYYNKADTEKFVLVDKKGNEFKYSTLSDDIKKHSGQKLDDVLRPYKQKEYLSAQKITQELNKLYGYKPGATKGVFHTQHIEGIDKNPFKVHLTFGTQNIKESASRKSFNADWKAATYVDENGKTKVRLNDVGKIGDANYKPGGKTAVNRYYKSLGPDIVAQIGKQPKGTAPLLTELLTRLKDTKGNTIMSPIIQDAIKNLNKNAELNGLVKNQIATVKRYTNKNGIKLNSFAGVVDLSQSGLKMPPAIKNALNTIVKYGGKTLRGVGKGAIVLDPIFAAYDASVATDRGASNALTGKYVVERFFEGIGNLPGLVIGGTKYGADKLRGKKNVKFKTPYELTFARTGLEKGLAKMSEADRIENIKQKNFDEIMYTGLEDIGEIPPSRAEILQAQEDYKNETDLTEEERKGLIVPEGIETLSEFERRKRILNLQPRGLPGITSVDPFKV